MDYDGNIDLKEYGLKGCDVVIASLHIPCIKPEMCIRDREWAWSLADQAHKLGIPVFMKEDLVPIIGDEIMIQEMPEAVSYTHLASLNALRFW